MTRVAGPQCSPYFQPDTAPDPAPAPPTPDSPQADERRQQPRRRTSKGKAQRLYELMQGKGRAARRAGKERASAERQGDIITAATQGAAGMIEEIPGVAVGQAVGAAGLLAVPLSAIWATLDGLATIGKAHADAQRGAEQRELRRGLARAVGLAVDHPQLSPGEIKAQLQRDGHYLDNVNRSKNPYLKIKAHSRKKWRKLGERFLEGAKEGLRLVRSLSPADKRQLAALLKQRVGGETSAERVSNLIQYGAKTHGSN